MNLERPAHVIANEIRLKRSSHRGAFVVVEGHDDHRTFGLLLDVTQVNITVARGKERVLEVIQTLDADDFPGALGVVDADFDQLDGVALMSQSLVRVDCHDLEATLIRSPAFSRLLIEFGSGEKIFAFEQVSGPVIEALLKGAIPIACLRRVSQQAGLNLRFKGITYSRFVDRQLLVNVPDLVRTVKNRSNRPDLDEDRIIADIERVRSARHDPWQLCNGADLIELLSLGLCRTIGSNKKANVSPAQLRRALRLTYDDVDFRATSMFGQMDRWQRSTGFRVLK